MSEPEAIQQAEEIDTIDHPLPPWALLVRNHPEENVEKILTVTQRLRDVDSDHFEYILACPTHTAYYRYREADVEDCFRNTGETCEEPKPVMLDWVRETVYGDYYC